MPLFNNADFKEAIKLLTNPQKMILYSKYKYYQEKYSQLEYIKDKPFIITIASFEQGSFFDKTSNLLIQCFIVKKLQQNSQILIRYLKMKLLNQIQDYL